MLSPLPRRSGWAYCFAHSPQPYQPSPKSLSGRPAHCPFRGLLGVHSRYGLHTRAVTVFRDTLSEGFSHFVTSMTAPVASGWSGCRVGLAPTGKAPPLHGAQEERTWPAPAQNDVHDPDRTSNVSRACCAGKLSLRISRNNKPCGDASASYCRRTGKGIGFLASCHLDVPTVLFL